MHGIFSTTKGTYLPTCVRIKHEWLAQLKEMWFIPLPLDFASYPAKFLSVQFQYKSLFVIFR